MATAKVVGQQRSPTGGESNAAVEIFVQAQNRLDVEPVRGDEAFAPGIAAARQQPADVFVSSDEGVFRVDALETNTSAGC